MLRTKKYLGERAVVSGHDEDRESIRYAGDLHPGDVCIDDKGGHSGESFGGVRAADWPVDRTLLGTIDDFLQQAELERGRVTVSVIIVKAASAVSKMDIITSRLRCHPPQGRRRTVDQSFRPFYFFSNCPCLIRYKFTANSTHD